VTAYTPGERVLWRHEPRGRAPTGEPMSDYDCLEGRAELLVPAVVLRVTPHRVRIRAQLAAGGTRDVTVHPERLTPAERTTP
jgi:hypothetical protein